MMGNHTTCKAVIVRTFYCVTLFIVALQTAHARCDLDEFPVTDNMKVTVLMDNDIYNGRPMSLMSFESNESVKEIINFYHRTWEDAYADSDFGPWQQITHINEECMMLVQVAEIELEKTQGRLNILNAPSSSDSKRKIGEGAIMPPDSRVVTDNISRDSFKKGRTLLIGTALTRMETARFYNEEMKRRGWRRDMSQDVPLGNVLTFRKGLDEFNIVIREGTDGSQILINTVEQ